MPTEIVYPGGGSVKVTADLDTVVQAIEAGAATLNTHQFAGFRGDEAAAGGRVVVQLSAVAHAIAIAAP